MKIVYLRRALEQIDAIHAWIAADNPAAADRVRNRIRTAVSRLKKLPYSARTTDMAGVRVLVVSGTRYLVFYEVDEQREVVTILRVRHSSHDPAHALD